MLNRQGPPENAKEMTAALRLETFRSDHAFGNQTGLPRWSEATARDSLYASLILKRTYPPPRAATRWERAVMSQRGPVQDECGSLDPLDRAAMDAVEGRSPGDEIEGPTPEAIDGWTSVRSKPYAC